MAKTIQIVKQKLSDFAQAVLSRISHQMELLRDTIRELLNMEPEYKGLVFTAEEEQAITDTASVLSSFFPEHPGKILVEEDYESRCEAIEDLVHKLADLYGLEGYDVEISEDPEVFGCGEGQIICGLMTPQKMYINSALLKSDDEEVLERLVSTVIHEFRHKMQLQTALGDRRYHVPYARRYRWRQNFANYDSGDFDFEAYHNQTIEFDARAFTERVWKLAFNNALQ